MLPVTALGTSSGAGAMVNLCVVALVVLATIGAEAQPLRTDFYDKSCPQIFSIVKDGIKNAVKIEKRMAASIVRLHLHDCFVNIRISSFRISACVPTKLALECLLPSGHCVIIYTY